MGEVHPGLFAMGKFKKIPHNKIQREIQNRPKNRDEILKNLKRIEKKHCDKMEKLKSLGIKYEFHLNGRVFNHFINYP